MLLLEDSLPAVNWKGLRFPKALSKFGTVASGLGIRALTVAPGIQARSFTYKSYPRTLGGRGEKEHGICCLDVFKYPQLNTFEQC